ncbi:MAG: class I SAM-dependent methyltransferase [Bdellovibrionales bacterium]|nr:class I SAM-dependent methyltransferase [Bdellovibrionales bacterium]
MKSPAHEKYLEKPFFGSSHVWAFEHLKNLSLEARVLDVGSGSGVIGRFLRERGVEQICAVEIDEQTVKQTSHLYKQISENIDNYPDQNFDVICVLDVFEHLTNPDAFLIEVVNKLKPGGSLLISVPNVAHWSVRFSLLFGFFNYTERGILDRTHLRFFTWKTLGSFLSKETRIRIVERAASIEPAEFVVPEYIWQTSAWRLFSRARFKLAQQFPGIFAYQALAVVKRIS